MAINAIDINKVSLIISGRRITAFSEDTAIPKITYNEEDLYKTYPGIMGTTGQSVKVAFRNPTIEFDLRADSEDFKFLKTLQLTGVGQVLSYTSAVGENYMSLNAVLKQVGENKEDTANGQFVRHIAIDLLACVETPPIS